MMLAVSSEDGRRRALEKALKILAYADNNEKTLYMKLIRQSFSPQEASFATEECVRLGYINEERQIENAIRSAYAHLEGPYKITARLLRRGYTSKAVRSVIDTMTDSGEIDFKAQRARLLREKLPREASSDEIKKLLHRYGYIK
jgi:SOS response regulatory protein OraA/RecX